MVIFRNQIRTMKKFTGSLLMLLCSFAFVNAQSDEYMPDEGDWFFYDLAYPLLLNTPDELEQGTWSNSHSLSLMQDYVFGRSKFGFAFGLTYTSVNYKNNLRIVLDESTGNAEFNIMPESVEYDENKLNIKYVELPLELRFRSKPNVKGNYFRLYLGAKFGVRFDAYSHFEDGDYEVSYHHPEALNRFRFGPYARIGYGIISLYGYYQLTDVFDYEHDPVIHNFDVNGWNSLAIGVSVSL